MQSIHGELYQWISLKLIGYNVYTVSNKTVVDSGFRRGVPLTLFLVKLTSNCKNNSNM